MRVTYVQGFFVALLGLLLASCSSSNGAAPLTDPIGNTSAGSTSAGDSSGGTPTGTPTGMSLGQQDAAAVSSIQGNWATACIPDMGLYFKRALAVSNENVEFALAFFSDANCTQAATVGLLNDGHSVAAQAVTVPTGDVVVTTIGDATAIDLYFGDVTLDGQIAPDSIAVTFAPEVSHTIVLVDGINLYLGDDALAGYDGSTPATRPISLDFDVVYSRTP